MRAAINLSNFLLVSGQAEDGTPHGVAPDLARAIAARLGVDIAFRTYPKPSQLADAAPTGAWDIGLIGAEPARAEFIQFSPAYCEIESTYLVPAGSPIAAIADADRPGVRIAVAARTAYGLWLDRNIRNATLVPAEGLEESFTLFVQERLDALASLRPRLLTDVQRLPGSRLLEGRFTAVQQSIGVPRGKGRAADYLRDFARDAISSGLVASLIAKHAVQGLTVAPLLPPSPEGEGGQG